MKKKAIKIAAASAVAASAFVAAAPLQSEAASNVQSEVSKAVTQIQKAYHTYSDPTAKGQFADLKAVYKEYNAAKVAYANAKAVVNKAGGSQKDANLALLDVNYNDFIAKRVVTYIDAYNYGKALEGLKNDLEADLTAGDWVAAEAGYHKISYELKTRTVILDRVYGKTARELLRSEFKASAQELRDSIKNEVTVKMALDAAAKAIDSKDLATAKTQIEKAEAALTLVDKNTEMGKDLVAYATAVKTAYEALVTPAVDSVTVLNSTQLVVKFNKELDKAAVTADKFKLEGKGTPTVSVADDNKTVTLTYGNVEGTLVSLIVEPIQTKADAKVSTQRYVSKLTYTDSVAPTASKVEYTYSADGKATAKFTFSEPLAYQGVVSVNGVTTSVTTDLAKGEVSVAGLEVGKTYKVDFVGTQDVKGNIANPITQTVTVPAPVKDEVKPVAAVSISANTVTLQFSEEVATLGTVTINGGANLFGSFVQDANDKTKYVLDAQAAGTLNGVNFLNATVVVDGFKDKAGNAAEKVTTSGTLTADRTAPAFVSAAASADNSKILLTFNDEVKAGDLTSADELVLKVKDGVTLTNSKVDLTAASVQYGVDLDGKDGIKGSEKNVVAINYGLAAKSSYSFDVAGKVFADSYNNKVADTLTFSLNVGEVTPAPTTPQAVVAFDGVGALGNVITVDYNAEMGDSALAASNYKFAGNALPSGSTLKFVNSREVVQITLPAGFVTVNGWYVLEVTGVTAKNNDTLANGKVSAPVFVGETIAPVATKVNVADSKHLTVDFSESVNAPAAVAGVTVKVNGTAVTTTSVTVLNNQLAIATEKDFASTDSITVEFKDTNLQDANGNKVANSSISK